MNTTSAWVTILVGSAAAIGCLTVAFYNLNRKRIIDDTPTSRTQGVFIGLAELKGTAESETPLTSYLAASKCVQYSWKIEEQWRRVVTEIVSDGKGHTTTRTRVETGWTDVGHADESQSFYLKDDTGVIRIVPEEAKIQGNETFKKTVNRSDPLYYGKGPEKAIANSTSERRFHETVVPLHAMLYVLGQARERQDIVAAEIAHDKSSPMFLISTKTEMQVSSGYGVWTWCFGVLGILAALGGGAWWGVIVGNGSILSPLPFVIMAAGYLIVWTLIWVWFSYNSLINLHHRVEQGWSQVEIQLKRRYDLMPNLAQAVEGYKKYENETQSVVADLRGQMEATPPGLAGPDYRGVATSIQSIIERYPDLKTSESFLRLQESLVDTEQRIALARDYFNDIATFFNTRLVIIPDRYVAALARFRPQTLMIATEFERAAVEVNLAD